MVAGDGTIAGYTERLGHWNGCQNSQRMGKWTLCRNWYLSMEFIPEGQKYT